MAAPIDTLKALYFDHDSRRNMCDLRAQYVVNDESEKKLERFHRLARSVGCLVKETDFKKGRRVDDPWTVDPDFFESERGTLEGSVKMSDHVFRDSKINFNIRFKNEPSLGLGTAFLIGSDLALTAAHCICDQEKPDRLLPGVTLLVFGYKRKDEPKDRKWEKLTFKPGNVYKVVSVVAYNFTAMETTEKKQQDWAILKLDRVVERRSPLNINYSTVFTTEKKVWMLGYPGGTPLKWAGDAEIQSIDHKKWGTNYYGTDISGFKGNSGAPMFYDDDDSEEVIGMFCGGLGDYQITEKSVVECKPTQECIAEEGYEYSLKLAALTFLKGTLESIDYQFSHKPLGYENGLSLEGICNNPECHSHGGLVVHSIGFSPTCVDIGQLCCDVPCSSCQQNLEYDQVNTMILLNCNYTFKGKRKGMAVEEMTAHRSLNKKDGAMRFNIDDWTYIQLTILPI